MRFTCGNCGRAYLADDRIQRLAFKMPCRSCGQIISVTPAQASAPGELTSPAPEVSPPPAARKPRLAPLVVTGVVMLAAAGGVAWALRAARAPAPAVKVFPEVSPAPVSAPISAPAPAPSPSVEAAVPPAEPAVPVQAPTPKAEPVAGKKRSPPASPVAAAAPAIGASAPTSPVTAGPEPAAIPVRPPRPDLPPLDEQQIRATLSGYAGTFDDCVAEARRAEPDLLASPRPVVVTLTVRPSGQAIYPTLDDAQLSGTALGACVKRQSERMVFPESGGEPIRVRMPLVLGR